LRKDRLLKFRTERGEAKDNESKLAVCGWTRNFFFLSSLPGCKYVGHSVKL